jgi:hypothetical protein
MLVVRFFGNFEAYKFYYIDTGMVHITALQYRENLSNSYCNTRHDMYNRYELMKTVLNFKSYL